MHTPYAELTHLARSPRALWIGTKRSVYLLPRRLFEDEEAPDILARCLLSRVASLPDGRAQLERMALLEEASVLPTPCRATWGLTLLCLGVFVAQIFGGANVEDVGFFGGLLVADGDLWRIVTANFLHAFPEVPIHLGLNLLGLIAMGTLTERPLGFAATVVVMGASGLGAMGASAIAGYERVIGVSGVVFGLVGAVTWLELRCAERLPAWWRVPRRALYTMLGVSVLIPLFVPVIAAAAHLGGFLAGGGAAMLVAGRLPVRGVTPSWVRLASASVLVVCVLAIGFASSLLVRPDEYVAGRVAQLARLPDVSSDELNNRAWLIAIDPESAPVILEAAMHLAERAAKETERSDANVLDTLAELQFLLGRDEEAVATIEEAIAQEPSESYFQEQRRRFRGERDRDDRPKPPGPQIPQLRPSPEQDPGLTV